jgi:hypothetical protein
MSFAAHAVAGEGDAVLLRLAGDEPVAADGEGNC